MKPPLCIGVHALFASGAFEALSGAGLERIITSNTVSHPTNGVDVSGLIAAFV
jgi:ribose-phosphate pyrophosphokinase